MTIMKKLLYHVCAGVLAFCGLCSSAMAQEGTSLIRNRGVLKTVEQTRFKAPTASSSADLTASTRSVSNEQASNRTFPSLIPTSKQTSPETDIEKASGMRVTSPLITVTSSLAVVLGLFAALIWVTRKFGGRSGGTGTIPKEVFQDLGSTSIDPRTQISLLRCGQRILIIARTSNGLHPLGEITNAEEVNHLTAACLGDSKQAFHTALQSMESEPSDAGYLGNQTNRPNARSRERLFATA